MRLIIRQTDRGRQIDIRTNMQKHRECKCQTDKRRENDPGSINGKWERAHPLSWPPPLLLSSLFFSSLTDLFFFSIHFAFERQ